jgi:hypothetical protein
MAEIPKELFDRLLKLDSLSTKSLALIAQALSAKEANPDLERCPHCGGNSSRWT